MDRITGGLDREGMRAKRMSDMKGKIQLKVRYFFDSVLKLVTRTGLACPSCGNQQSTLVKRKYLVTSLRRCSSCRLLFRIPTSSESENKEFYQRKYQQGFTTEMPNYQELRQLKSTMFRNTEKDYSNYIKVLKALGLKAGTSLLDYGCSWGYGSWQLQKAGYSVQSYEISRPRCEYAKKFMRVDATWEINDLEERFDIFFSAHVLEHVLAVGDVISLAMKMLKPGGRFVAFTPNGSDVYRKAHPWQWQCSWGLVHPNLIDKEYYRFIFNDMSFLVASSPYDCDAIKEWMCIEDREIKQKVLKLSGKELLCAVKAPSI